MELEELFNDLHDRVLMTLRDNEDYSTLFKHLKGELMNSYLKNDFRISVLKHYASELIAIILLAETKNLQN